MRSQTDSINFYIELKPFHTFDESFNLLNYKSLPEDWHVIVADVRGSTQAIQQGAYKTINWIGACCIMSVQNAVKPLEIPFVFGGDGATFAVHDSVLAKVLSALMHVKDISLNQFQLELRVGSVRVSELKALGTNVLVSKWRMNKSQHLAMFAGTGLDEAEKLIKAPGSHHVHQIVDFEPKGNLEGLSCRWNPIENKRGKIVTILVQPQGQYKEEVLEKTWRDILVTLNKSKQQPQIFAREQLVKKEIFPWRGFINEYKSNVLGKKPFEKFVYGSYLFLRVAVAQMYFKFNLITQQFNTPHYLDEVYKQSDFRKLDGTLRMVLDLTSQEWLRIRALLEIRHRKGQVFFGSHVSKSALMTCALFDETQGQHLHFMDGNDGGYALAAVELKQQRKRVSEQLQTGAEAS